MVIFICLAHFHQSTHRNPRADFTWWRSPKPTWMCKSQIKQPVRNQHPQESHSCGTSSKWRPRNVFTSFCERCDETKLEWNQIVKKKNKRWNDVQRYISLTIIYLLKLRKHFTATLLLWRTLKTISVKKWTWNKNSVLFYKISIKVV